MKNKTAIFRNIILIIFTMMICSKLNYSQTYIDVPPGIGTLNDAITNNTDPNAIFRLRKRASAIYLLNGSVQSVLPLHIRASSDTGAIPKLIPIVGTSGASRCFLPY